MLLNRGEVNRVINGLEAGLSAKDMALEFGWHFDDIYEVVDLYRNTDRTELSANEVRKSVLEKYEASEGTSPVMRDLARI